MANEYKYTSDNIFPIGFRNMNEPSVQVFYLCGGGRYTLYTDFPTEWKFYTSKHIFYNDYPNIYVEPRTSNPGFTADGGIVTIK